jgi:DNA-binding NtrC family response regulator
VKRARAYAHSSLRLRWVRDRLTDVPLLLRHFLAPSPSAMSAGFVEAALLHRWPMNVRQLKNLAARCRLLGVKELERTHFEDLAAELLAIP